MKIRCFESRLVCRLQEAADGSVGRWGVQRGEQDTGVGWGTQFPMQASPTVRDSGLCVMPQSL